MFIKDFEYFNDDADKKKDCVYDGCFNDEEEENSEDEIYLD